MNYKLVVFFVGCLMLSTSSSVYLRCAYEQMKHIYGTSIEYSCRAVGLVIDNCFMDLNITELFGNHLGISTNNDVLIFYINNQPIEYLPNGVGRYFPNLTTYQVISTPLKYIRRDNFEDLLYLKYVSIYSNQIKELDSTTFMYNKNIIVLHMTANKMRIIGADLLSYLTNVQKVMFGGNVCIDYNAENVAQINALSLAIRDRCFDTSYDYYHQQQKTINDLKIQIEILVKNNSQCAARIVGSNSTQVM